MTPERFRLVDRLFHGARALAPEARAAYLAAECGNDSGLRQEVDALLSHDGLPQAYLETAQLGSEFRLTPAGRVQRSGEMPARIGPYRVLRVLGEGGMGVVYEAEQETPRRTVALKVIRATHASDEVLRRFENEANVLGRLQHPGIAQIFEAGTAEIGGVRQMYLAMELVAGQQLIRYAQERALSVPDRLELLARVCDAVQHAHQKGVIHRDLKPGNILVVEETASRTGDDSRARSAADHSGLGSTLQRAGAQPKVLDFGVARVIDADVAAVTMQTDHGQLIGTLPYMSPEQVLGAPDSVDTRSDVYSLGVLLHELLTGQLPYDVRNRPVPEAARIICDQQATRLSSISRAFRGEIDTIVAKALEKDKARRYQSAADFAADIRAHLAGAPIAAKRDSAWYVVQKTLRRYRLAAAAGMALLVVVSAAAVALAFLYNHAEQQAGLARTERDRAATAEQVARDESSRARTEARKATLVSNFLRELLQSANPKAMLGTDVRVRDALDAAAARVARDLGDEPSVEAKVRMTIGQTYFGLGLYPQAIDQFRAAEPLLRKEYPGGHDDLVETIAELAVVASLEEDYAGALQRFREAETVHRQIHAEENTKLAWLLMNQGTVHRLLKQPAEGERLLREAIRIYRALPAEEMDDDRECPLADALTALGAVLHGKGAFDEAEAVTQEALQLFRERLGESHPEIAPVLNNLAAMKRGRGDLAGALPLYYDALAMVRKHQGDDHPDVALALNNIGLLLSEMNNDAAAEPVFREALTIRRNRLPPRNPTIADTLVGLGATLNKLGRAAEAEPLLREALDIRREGFANQWQPQTAASILGECLVEQGRFAEAEPLLVESHERLAVLRGPAHGHTLAALRRIVTLYEKWDKAEAAAKYRVQLDAARAATAPAARGG
jgi:serine/threonine protein kinase